VWPIVLSLEKYANHPLRDLIGMSDGIYHDFDLAKEREAMWPERE
jgi:hypothetical protein